MELPCYLMKVIQLNTIIHNLGVNLGAKRVDAVLEFSNRESCPIFFTKCLGIMSDQVLHSMYIQ